MSNWKFLDEHIITLNTIGDGNCFFHAILQSFFKPYIEGYDSSKKKPFPRREAVSSIRKDLSRQLDSRYDTLSRGQLRIMSKDMPIYSLENMKALLESNHPVGIEFLEFISEILDLDIYILDKDKKDVYMIGDYELVHKNRSSIVIAYGNGHYETVALKHANKYYKTKFDPGHNFIVSIRNRIKQKKSEMDED